MKYKLLYLFVFIIFSCTEKKVTSITIISENERDKLDSFEIIRPIDDIILWKENKDTIYRNDKGILKFQTNIEKPEIIRIIVDNKWLRLVLQPNKNYVLTVTDTSKVFTGENSVGSNYFNKIKRPIINTVFNTFANDTIAEQIVTKIDSLKNLESKELNRLNNDNLIDEDLYKILKTDVDYTYADLLISVILVKDRIGKPINFNKAKELITKTIKEYPIEIENRPLYWTEHAQNYIINKEHFYNVHEGKFTYQELQKYWEEDKLITNDLEIIKSISFKETQEKLWAFYIISNAVQKHYEKSLITAFNDFDSTFPNSIYTQFIKPEIDIIKNYYSKINQEMPKTMKFIDGKKINSLSELIPKLNGEKYYVDVWATWCGPCKKEFKHNKKLDSLLKEYNYKKIYISIDKEDLTQKWKDYIKFYDLTGTHTLANPGFVKDFTKNHSLVKNGISIPQYLIIDNKGNIVSNNAPRPSNINKLREILVK
ncbi:TlpA family protein disulfide reductase [Polaribacter sp.]|uniref:TlpA family protein disulfide reductase n=1 Tax=Polaribacter sp. TaxID=1920175 RepID=UPI003F6A86EB